MEKQSIEGFVQEVLNDLDGTEVLSTKYEGVVGINGNQVIRNGEVIDLLDSNEKIMQLFNEQFYNEFGTDNPVEQLRYEFPEENLLGPEPGLWKLSWPQKIKYENYKESVKKFEVDEKGILYLYLLNGNNPTIVVWPDGRAYKYLG